MELPTAAIGSIDRLTRASAVYRDRANVVVMYHSIGGGGYGNIPPSWLADHIETLSKTYDIVDLPEVLNDEGSKKVALTFDDGYHDFHTNALPILRRYEVPATVFLVADAYDGDEVLRHCDYEPMTRAEVADLVDDELITIGNHTRSHLDLETTEDPSILREEIIGAKRYLEGTFGTTVDRFCYPFNSYTDVSDEIVRECHEYAVKVDGLFERITSNTDPFRIPRISGSYPTRWMNFATSDLARDTGSLTRMVVGDVFSRRPTSAGDSPARSYRDRAVGWVPSKSRRS